MVSQKHEDILMDCEILWNTLSPQAWEERFAKIPRSNLLQSYDYARAVCPRQRLRGRWGLITIGGAEAGIVQILETGVFKNALHAVILDRGPLWFEGFDTAAHIESFFRYFNRAFPRRIGRRRRIIPEIPDTPEMRAIMDAAGFRRLARPGYQTIWLDLGRGSEALWENMESSWRNKVRKAEKAALAAEWDYEGKEIPALLSFYQSDKAKKGYDGPSVPLLRSLANSFLENKGLVAGTAKRQGRIVAAVLIFRHGTAATYQVGWSTDEGKETAAHNFLLWQAAAVLKDKGLKHFDLGGANDESAQGVKAFKEGMGGETITLAGHYF